MQVVVIEHHAYDSPLRVGSHQIAAELCRRGHQVIWISHPRSVLHRLLGRPAPRGRRHANGVLEIVPRVLLPYVNLPILGSIAWGRQWLRLAPWIAAQLSAAGDRKVDLLWLSDFTLLPILDHIGAERVVYRFFDHLDQFRWMPRSIFRLAAEYHNRADLVVATSEDVRRRLAQHGIDATYLPNGGVLWPQPATPRRRENRVVYVGAMGPWLDFGAVELWARALPDVGFDLVGPNPGLRSKLSNVRFLGPVPHDQLPELLWSARFGLIPFHVNELTRGVHPIKLYDYLAAGCPVLSSDLPEVPGDWPGVFTYRDPTHGLEILRRHLCEEIDPAPLRERAAEHTWSRRLDEVFVRLGMPSSPAA